MGTIGPYVKLAINWPTARTLLWKLGFVFSAATFFMPRWTSRAWSRLRQTDLHKDEKMLKNVSRVTIAALVAPLSTLLTVPVAALVWALYRRIVPSVADLPALFVFSGLVTIFAYVMLFLFGLPAYFVLRRMKLDSIWTAIIVGYVAALLVPLLFQLSEGISLRSHGIQPAIAYSNLQKLLASPSMFFLNPLVFVGPVVGGIFLLVANTKGNRINSGAST